MLRWIAAMLITIPAFAYAQPQPDAEKAALGDQVMSQLREIVLLRADLHTARQEIDKLKKQVEQQGEPKK